MDYERGLDTLKQQARDAPWQGEFLTMESRLRENLSHMRRYGDTETRRAERAQIVDALNGLTLQQLGMPFIDLCLPSEPSVTPLSPIRPDRHWDGGAEMTVGHNLYLLHDPVEEILSPDRSFVRRRAKGWQQDADQMVWLKQVLVNRATPFAIQARDALRHEARILGQLQHQRDFPRLVDVESADQVVTLVHSLAPGPTLSQAFAQLGTALDAERVYGLLRSMRSLCAMLDVLHRGKMSHRHLTPDAIVLLKGHHDHAVLQDLGLAAQPRVPDEGPPIYRAPEQHQAMLALPGPRTDIYQLGAVLYHLLTGRAPSLFWTDIELPSAWNSSLPSALDHTLLRALAKNPDDRWPTVRDMRDALDQAADELASIRRENL
jgi:serine/threonine protein kinase